MTISRTIDWRLNLSPEHADAAFFKAFSALGLNPSGQDGHVEGKSKMNLRKNRWAVAVAADIRGLGTGSIATLRVDMPAGTKHYEVAADIASALGAEVLDDRGVDAARDRLGKVDRASVKAELQLLQHYLTGTETVHEIARGFWDSKSGMVVLSDERLFLFDKSFVGTTLVEYSLPAITSVSLAKAPTGEALTVTVAGNASTIKNLGHGQGDALARTFRELKSSVVKGEPIASVPVAPRPTDGSYVDDLEKLAALRDRGILTDDEFAAKKADILARI